MSNIEDKLRNHEAVTIGTTELSVPSQYDRARNGALIVVDEGDVQDVSCSVYLFTSDLECTFSKSYPAAGSACAIRRDGTRAVLATLQPDDRIYGFDVQDGSQIWSRANHEGWTGRSQRPPVTDLSFEQDTISVYTRGIEEYQLDADGRLTETSRERQEPFTKLDEQDEGAVDHVRKELESGDRARNIKALTEIEVRLDQPFIQKQMVDLVDPLVTMIKQHELHTLDLTDPETREADRKVMSSGKRLLYEAGRQDPSVVEAFLPLIREHLQHQPPAAIQSDIAQLRRIDPDLTQDLPDDLVETGDSCDVSPMGHEPSDPSPSQDVPSGKKKEAQTGCGCATVLLLSIVSGTLITTLLNLLS